MLVRAIDAREYMDPPAPLDSCGMSTNADALRYLAEIGRVEIVSEQGRRVVERWKP